MADETKSTSELSSEQLEGVSGGYIFYNNENDTYEVLDDYDGHVMEVFEDYEDAVEEADREGMYTDLADWDTVKDLRRRLK